MKSKTIPYSAQWITPEDVKAVTRALTSSFLSQGPEVKNFEESVAKYCGVKYAVAVSSGTAALHLACRVACVGQDDEVITTPLTFLATSNAILYCGGKPVFADIDRVTYNLDLGLVERALTPKTKGIIPVHFAGLSVDMKRLANIAKEHGLFIIEDAAHALGGRYEGAPIGNCRYSDMTIFSFHPVKSITTAEGGMITTNNPDVYAKLLQLRNHGGIRNPALWQHKEWGGAESNGGGYPWYYEMQDLGLNYRLSDLHSALGSSQMKRLGAFMERRNEIAGHYWTKFQDLLPYVTLPNIPATHAKDSRSAWHLYPVLLKLENLGASRAEIVLAMRELGIEAHVHYMPVYLHPHYLKLGYPKGLCPNAEWYYERVVTLPVYPKMTKADIAKVVECFHKVVLKHRKPASSPAAKANPRAKVLSTR